MIPYLLPDPWFVKVVSPSGYPVAQFWTRFPIEESNYFLTPHDSLVEIVERCKAEGKPSPEHERALEALEAAIEQWAQTPWDGR